MILRTPLATRSGQTKRLRRLREAKALSIAVSTICTDGLVICAERQIEGSGFKFYESKLSQISLAPHKRKLVLGYAGSPDRNRVILERLRNKLENQDRDRQHIWNDLCEVLNETLPEQIEQNHQILCGFWDAGAFHLLKSFNRDVSPVPVWDCIGIADSALIRYLGGIFLEGRIHLPLYRAVPICVYLVSQAKKYIPGCGGPTDIVVVMRDGRTKEERICLPA
ncbi:MAG: hypothetical protein ACLQOO_11180 [Terriglobia bacterium]